MNGHWDELLRRLTRRLNGDRELQLDIQRELRTHLDDAAAEFRDAGESDESAAALAVKALGEEGELEESLWQANRWRMRLRGLFWWAARVALIPAAIATIILMLWTMSDGTSGVHGPRQLPRSWARQLSEDDKLLLGALPGQSSSKQDLEAVSAAMLKRWPDDPVVYAYYFSVRFSDWARPAVKVMPLADALALVERGKQLDPDNGYYDLMEAATLMDHAGEEVELVPETQSAADEPSCRDRWTFEMKDPELLARSLAALDRALAKPLITSRHMELIRRRVGVLPEATRLTHAMARMTIEQEGFVVGGGGVRRLARVLWYRAEALGGQGRTGEAMELLAKSRAMAWRLAQGSQLIIDVLVATAINAGAVDTARGIAEAAGAQEQAAELAEMQEAGKQTMDDFRKRFAGEGDPALMRYSGAFWAVFGHGQQMETADFEPVRSLEYAVGWELALWWGLVLGVLLALAMGLAVLVTLLRAKDRRPMLLFVGWRRLGRICLLAVVLPLGVYVLYAAAVTRWGGDFGVNYTFGRWLLELSLAAATMLTLLLVLGYAAVRQRAVELGLPTGGPVSLRRRKVFTTLAAVLGMLSLAYIIGWWAGPFRPEPDGFMNRVVGLAHYRQNVYASLAGAILAGAVGLWLAVWLVREAVGMIRRPRTSPPLGATVLRNLIPVLAVAVIVLGLAGGWALSSLEASAARRVTGAADVFSFTDEMRRPGAVELRQAILDQPPLPALPAEE